MTSPGPLSPGVERAWGNLATWSLALPALRELREHDVPVIVYKSLPLVEELYGNAGGRISMDVDLLVRSSDSLITLTTLQGLGWQISDSRMFNGLATALDPDRAAQRRAWVLTHPQAGSSGQLDLHSDARATWQHPPLTEAVWERAVEKDLDGARFLVLSPEDSLIFMCWHALASYLSPDHLRDVGEMLKRSSTLDWGYVRARSEQVGIAAMVSVVCDIAIGDLAAELPWRLPLRRRQTLGAKLCRGYSLPLQTARGVLARALLHDRRRYPGRLGHRAVSGSSRVGNCHARAAADLVALWPRAEPRRMHDG